MKIMQATIALLEMTIAFFICYTITTGNIAFTASQLFWWISAAVIYKKVAIKGWGKKDHQRRDIANLHGDQSGDQSGDQ